MYDVTDPEVVQFLDSIPKYSTKATYKTAMKFYLDFTGKTGKELLEIKKADTNFNSRRNNVCLQKNGYLKKNGK